MRIIADLELHSKYARAVSSSMTLPIIASWADKKGIDLVGTGDFTHPIWFRELETNLEEDGNGIFRLREVESKTRFMLTSEVSCVYSDKGKGRRVHLLVYLPKLSDVKKFNSELTKHGANLFSDGRPIMGLSLYRVASIAFSVNPKALVIPAHVWTPWYGFYGQMSGYDSLGEAFDDLTEKIPAIETGLSSDPAMNWKIEENLNRRIVSFGDAHSPQKLGREATVFEVDGLTYDSVHDALWNKGNNKLLHTIEFYPEEGKYHYTGHKKCKIVYSPKEAKSKGLVCPICGKQLTIGVMSRVEKLATSEIEIETEIDKNGVRWIKDRKGEREPYVMMVPLMEIIAESFGVGVATKAVQSAYENMIVEFGNEFKVLFETGLKDISKVTGSQIAESVKRVRAGDIFIAPGYDGVFGEVKIWKDEKDIEIGGPSGQDTLF
jgi:uncharacterized protein (TIGR00375 family)